MKNMLRFFYIFGLIIFVVVALGLYFQYKYFNNIVTRDSVTHITQSGELVESQIAGKLIRKAQIIKNVAGYVGQEKWDEEELLAYLRILMKNNPSFASIYYGTVNNHMINGSGWVPPENFDLRTRPWYIKAVSEEKLIFTEAFVNASKDKLIITIAQPVYNSNNQLLGVVGGDISMHNIIGLVDTIRFKENGYAFLIDGKGNILAHPNYEYDYTSELKNINEVSEGVNDFIIQNNSVITTITLDGIEGNFAYRPIEDTDWIVGIFIPLDEYMSSEILFLRIFIITLISSLMVFIVLFWLQKRYFYNPIVLLDRDVQKINIEDNIDYRVPVIAKDPFVMLRETINVGLNKTQEYFSQLVYLSYHDQLTGLYNRRFFEEELIRLDVKENLPITIVIVDVNGLKLINDSFGHKVGDELLKRVAEVLKKGCRSEDVISRIGGDEFVILLPNTNAHQTKQIINGIHAICSKEKVESVDLSISFGWETKHHEQEDIMEIFKKAEDYMYNNKLFEGPSMRSKTIGTIINTLHEKNKREEQHSKRVSMICRGMGIILGLPEEKIKELENVGLLHDIGKIAVDEAILNKADILNNDEWEQIKRHPEIGYRILSTVNEMSKMAEYVLYHHERWDGKGYPKGLSGEEIPKISRIITIAGTYDAMMSDRPYRKALSQEVVVEEIKRNAGTQFDPYLARVFVEKLLGLKWNS